MIGLIAVSFYLPCVCDAGRISELLEKLIENAVETISAKTSVSDISALF